MKASDLPTKFLVIVASGAAGGNIRVVPVTSADPNAMSETLGFPPNTLTPISSGGSPPDGRDFNGIFNQISAWNQWQAAGAPAAAYDSTFSTAIGGYPAGALLSNPAVIGYFWLSLVDDNTSDPDTGGANWQAVSLQGSFTTGDVKLSFKTAADPGWIPMNDGSIGSASSGATTLANAAALPLYTLMWNNMTNTWAPVAGGRGVSAAADFAANKAMTLPKALGRALASAGAGAGLTSRALGQSLGEETHTMTLGELVPHAHNYGYATTSVGSTGSQQLTDVVDNSQTTTTTGSGTPFNQMQPTTFLNVFVKL